MSIWSEAAEYYLVRYRAKLIRGLVKKAKMSEKDAAKLVDVIIGLVEKGL